MTKDWKQANRYFYALARRCNMSREDIAATIIGNYPPRVSTSELTAAELLNLCAALQQRAVAPQEQVRDQWRKRLIAAVRRYLNLMGYPSDMTYIRSVIERDGTPLNDLPLDRLRSLYNAFCRRNRDLQNNQTTAQTTNQHEVPNTQYPTAQHAVPKPLGFTQADA